MSTKITIEVSFRYCPKFERVEMFYYDEYKNLMSFCMEEGHNEASHDYYLSLKHTNGKQSKEIQENIKRITNYYNDEETQIKVMKKLKYRVCSYA